MLYVREWRLLSCFRIDWQAYLSLRGQPCFWGSIAFVHYDVTHSDVLLRGNVSLASPSMFFFVPKAGQQCKRHLRPCCVRHRWSVEEDESAACKEHLQHSILPFGQQDGIRPQPTGDVRCRVSLRRHLCHRSRGREQLGGVDPIYPGKGNWVQKTVVPKG